MANINTYIETLQGHFIKEFDFPKPSLLAAKWEDFALIEKCISFNLKNSSNSNKIYIAKMTSLHYTESLKRLTTSKRFEKDDEQWYIYVIGQLDKMVVSMRNEIDLESNFNFEKINKLFLPYKEMISSYDNFIKCLEHYFLNDTFPEKVDKIKVSKINKKGFASLLNAIFINIKSENERIPFEYISFFKNQISIFKDIKLSKVNYTKSTLYTYFKSNTILKPRKM